MADALKLQTIYLVGIVLLGGFMLRLLMTCLRHRRMVAGLPGPPHSFFFGHLLAMSKVARKFPPDVHPHVLPYELIKEYKLPPVFYTDTWPILVPTMMITDADAAAQVTQKTSLDKHRIIGEALAPIAESSNLVAANGAMWKTWRAVFNPGFAPGHLMTLVPLIVDATSIFCDILREHTVAGDVFPIEEAAARLTIDIIGRVVMDVDLGSQTSPNELVDAFRSQVKWLPIPTLAPWTPINLIRPAIWWWYTRKMKRTIGEILERRFSSEGITVEEKLDRKKRRPIIDLALETYVKEFQKTGKLKPGQAMDETFKAIATTQIKVLLFAGYDTTSSTIAWIYYLLKKNPTAHARILKEHDDVFGADPSVASDLLKESPHLLNQLPYTLAVIKETLRLFPVASTFRAGSPSVNVTYDGKTYPTDGFLVWPVVAAIHKQDHYFSDPDTFHPERFLEDNIHKDAFRPFEKGPRNCIGQELALIEARVILVMTLRTFDITPAYDAGKKNSSLKEFMGERAYQILKGTAKPVEGLPCKVGLRVS